MALTKNLGLFTATHTVPTQVTDVESSLVGPSVSSTARINGPYQVGPVVTSGSGLLSDNPPPIDSVGGPGSISGPISSTGGPISSTGISNGIPGSGVVMPTVAATGKAINNLSGGSKVFLGVVIIAALLYLL